MNYLEDIPELCNDIGFSKVLAVRHENIHLKHIWTEIFVRKTIKDFEERLALIDYTLFDYMEIMTNRMRRIFHFPREYEKDCNEVLKESRTSFFPTIKLYNGMNNVIVLDFDGVVTKNSFKELYKLCHERCEKVYICSANPTISEQYFIGNELPIPHKIYSMKGAKKKLRQLIEISKRFDNTFYIDDESMYLNIAWLFGIKTWQYRNNKIMHYSLKSK